MKLATYKGPGGVRLGAVVDGAQVIDLAEAARAAGRSEPAFDSMLDMIAAGPDALAYARELTKPAATAGDHRLPLAQVRLLAPIPVPPQIRDFSLFPLHVRQSPRGMRRLLARRRGDEAEAQAAQADAEPPAAYLERPIYYISNRFNVIGPDVPVTWPRYSQVMDFELEIAAIIGRSGKNIAREDARAHIFGYTIFNDFSARDRQADEMAGRLGPAKGKSFDGGNAMGPWIVTADEIADPYRLSASVRVNGETWTRSSMAHMMHTFEDVIAYVSEDETLHPGEVFGSGTMNNGCGLEIDRFLADGDTVELDVESIGVLRNRVVRQRD